jgi:hypothetical protein
MVDLQGKELLEGTKKKMVNNHHEPWFDNSKLVKIYYLCCLHCTSSTGRVCIGRCLFWSWMEMICMVSQEQWFFFCKLVLLKGHSNVCSPAGQVVQDVLLCSLLSIFPVFFIEEFGPYRVHTVWSRNSR